MRRLVCTAFTLAIAVLQPTLAVAQRTPSGFVKIQAEPVQPRTTLFPEVQVLQAIPVTVNNADIPPGIAPAARCLVGTPDGVAEGSNPTIQFVGNVLCLDPGPSGDFASFAQNCPRDTTPVIQSVQLTKIEPQIPKCPDTFPGGTFVQTPRTTGIRTWWTLKLTPCNTLFRLELTFACVRPAGRDRGGIVEVRTNVFQFRVVVLPRTLSWVIQALHNEPLGLCEIPCITDEGLFDLLLRQARTIRLEAQAGPSRIRELNQALDEMEATIAANCLMTLSVAQVTTDRNGNITRIAPCGLFPDGPPGNFTINSRGFGIVDTLENPCCCKLFADIFCLKQSLIGRDP